MVGSNIISFIDKLSVKSDSFVDISFVEKNIDCYVVRQAIFQALTKSLRLFCGKMLDVGCGKMPYKEYICTNSETESYIGLDIEEGIVYDNSVQPDSTWNGRTMPFADAWFDCAIATEVFEHCPDPEAVMSEICRVLKPEGLLFFTVPFLWPLHEVPHDHYRYTPFSLRHHLITSGFTSIKIEPLGGWDASLAQMLGLWVRRRPMGKWWRRILSVIALPVIYFLLHLEKVTQTHFNEGSMITGLSGICIKPK